MDYVAELEYIKMGSCSRFNWFQPHLTDLIRHLSINMIYFTTFTSQSAANHPIGSDCSMVALPMAHTSPETSNLYRTLAQNLLNPSSHKLKLSYLSMSGDADAWLQISSLDLVIFHLTYVNNGAKHPQNMLSHLVTYCVHLFHEKLENTMILQLELLPPKLDMSLKIVNLTKYATFLCCYVNYFCNNVMQLRTSDNTTFVPAYIFA